jgi:intraflagellar transport protein 74
LKETIETLDGKRNDLAVQLNESNLSFPEARDRLLARIKEDNQLIVTNDKKCKEI